MWIESNLRTELGEETAQEINITIPAEIDYRGKSPDYQDWNSEFDFRL